MSLQRINNVSSVPKAGRWSQHCHCQDGRHSQWCAISIWSQRVSLLSLGNLMREKIGKFVFLIALSWGKDLTCEMLNCDQQILKTNMNSSSTSLFSRFPTLYFSPAGQKMSPKKYEVSLTFSDLMSVLSPLSCDLIIPSLRSLRFREVARWATSSATWRGRPPTPLWWRRSPKRRRRRRRTTTSQSYKSSKLELGAPPQRQEEDCGIVAEKELNYIPVS